MFDLTPFDRRNHIDSYNPFRLFKDIEENLFKNSSIGEFRTDIKDNGNSYILEADLPGFKKEDINIDIDDDYLTINANRKSEREDKDNQGNFIKMERSYGSFSRSFNISSINAGEITAEYTDGVLKLTMPKKDNLPPTSRRLEIK